MTEPRAREDRSRLSGGEQAASEQVGDPGTTVAPAIDTTGQPFQLMPPLSPEEFAALRDDIAEHGQRVPIDTDQHGRILDGHHRAQVCAELGIEPITRVVTVDNDEAGRAHALTVNLTRRHLTRDQRRLLVLAALQADPHLSDRVHATRCGVSPTTVGAVRALLLERGQLSSLDSRTGADGRRRSVRRDPEYLEVEYLAAVDAFEAHLATIGIHMWVLALCPTQEDQAQLLREMSDRSRRHDTFEEATAFLLELNRLEVRLTAARKAAYRWGAA